MTQITIPNVATEVTYAVTSSSTGPFIVPFPFFEEEDVRAEVTTDAGVTVTLLVTSDFIFSDKTAPLTQEGSGYTGGEITLNTAIGSDGNTEIRIFRQTVIDRTSNYPATGPFSVVLLNDEQNKHIMIMQEAYRDALARYPSGDLANFIFSWDANGDPEANIDANAVRALLAGASSSNTALTNELFTGDGATVDFTLAVTPLADVALLVSIDGVLQRPTTDYTLASDVLTFAEAPDVGAVIAVRNIGTAKTFGDSSAIGQALWPQTTFEAAAGVSPTDFTYEPGNVLRYGAVADSASETAGTDCTAAFQSAVDSGHAVYVPAGWYSIEGTVEIWGKSQGSTQAEGGGRTFIMNSGARIERFSAASGQEPLLHIQGSQNYVDGNGGIIGARLGTGFTKGLVLYGVDPTETDHTADGAGSMYYGQVKNFKIIGKTANTGFDDSVGFYVNSAKRKRGDFTSTNSCPVYYNTFSNIMSQQWDFPFHVSSEANFNVFVGCSSNSWGHASYSVIGYGNYFEGCKSETPTANATIHSIDGITLGCPTIISLTTDHNLKSGHLIRLSSITDTGAGTLEAALNTLRFEATVVDSSTFSIPVDTTGLAAWSSGGSMSQERYVWYWGRKDDPFTPEVDSDSDAATTTNPISGITKGNPTTITCVGHGLTSTDKIRIDVDSIVDSGPNGDLEHALNGGHFQITSTGANTFTIPVDTSGLTTTWVSGGTIRTDFLPLLGARANNSRGPVEFAFTNPNQWVRTMGYRDPVTGYDDPVEYMGSIGKNVGDWSGTQPGGIGRDGQSDAAGVGDNIVRTTATDINRAIPVQYHDLFIRKLDDDTGSGYGGEQYRTFAGRMASMAESTAYDVLTVDNVGPNDAGCAIKLFYIIKEDSESDVEAGEISWLCPVTANTNRTAIKYKDFTANENGPADITWSIVDAAGTEANTGKFTLRITTGNPTGTGNFYCAWKVEIIHTELYETELDWDSQVTITNGGL